MSASEVRAPVALLRDPELSQYAVFLWLLLRLGGPATQARLTRLSGLAKGTVHRALSQLASTAWAAKATSGLFITSEPANPGTTVTFPGPLLTGSLGVQPCLLYGFLQVFQHQGQSQFTYPALEALMGVSRETARLAIRKLAAAGWLTITQKHRHAPICFDLTTPGVAAPPDSGVAGARRRIERAEYKGEQIMREWLSLLVDSTDYKDNGFFGWLQNPATSETLQLDRYYSHPDPGVGFEYNGRQHEGPTDQFPSTEEARQQRSRDLMKIGLCVLKGVPLVIVRAEDLTLEGMQRKVGALLPLRDLAGRGQLITFLERRSQRYRQNANE